MIRLTVSILLSLLILIKSLFAKLELLPYLKAPEKLEEKRINRKTQPYLDIFALITEVVHKNCKSPLQNKKQSVIAALKV